MPQARVVFSMMTHITSRRSRVNRHCKKRSQTAFAKTTTRSRALIAGTAILWLAACGGPRNDTGTPIQAPPVEAVPARHGALPLAEELSGVVRALNQVAIRPEISGTVVEVLARNGNAVTAGQPLVRLEAETLTEQLRRAEAELRVAEASAIEARARVEEVRARAVRTRALAAEGLSSELELETLEAQLAAISAGAGQAEATVEQARAVIQERRSALSKATIRAPVDGVVGQRGVEIGMVVGPSSILFLVGDLEELVVEVPLTQEMLERVTEGTPVVIDAGNAAGTSIEAMISRISPFLEASSFSTSAEIDVTGASSVLRPGMFVAVEVLVGTSSESTLLPASAIWEDPLTGDWVVFVVTENAGLVEPEAPSDEIPEQARAVEMRPVTIVADGGNRVAVDGVDAGEWVVTLGQHLLRESMQSSDGGPFSARVRPTTWDRILDLAALQREDLLEQFLAKQRVVARTLGAELPKSTAEVDAAIRAAEAGQR
jgi:RND family efflux transporter MFP subunit